MEVPTEEHHSESLNSSEVMMRRKPTRLNTSVINDITTTQPLLTLSGLGLAYGSLKSAMRKIKGYTTIVPFKLPKYVRRLPKYMKNKYVRYPLLFMFFLAAARHVRSKINH